MNTSHKSVIRRRLALMAVATTLPMITLAGIAAAEPGIATIGPGSSNNHTGVACVQAAVGARIDGQYGQQTYTKVKAFQQAHHLSVDGAVGPHTGDAIVAVNNHQGYTGCYYHVPTTYSRNSKDAQPGSGNTPTVQP